MTHHHHHAGMTVGDHGVAAAPTVGAMAVPRPHGLTTLDRLTVTQHASRCCTRSAPSRKTPPSRSAVAEALAAAEAPMPLARVTDGRPPGSSAALSGSPVRCLGTSEFGRSPALDGAYRPRSIDVRSTADPALPLARL